MDPKVVGLTIIFSVGFLSAAAVAILRGPLGKSIGRMLEAPDENDLARSPQIAELAGRVAEMDELRHRLAEVEERLDFQERLLAERGPRALPREREEV